MFNQGYIILNSGTSIVFLYNRFPTELLIIGSFPLTCELKTTERGIVEPANIPALVAHDELGTFWIVFHIAASYSW